MDQIDNIGSFLDDNTMVWKRQFSAPPEQVWKAIATKEGLSHWFMPTKYEIVKGGRFFFEGGWEGTITKIVPLKFIQFEADDTVGTGSYVRFEIEPNKQGTLFTLINKVGEGCDVNKIYKPDTPKLQTYQPGGPSTPWTGNAGGYHDFVDVLENHVTGSSISNDYDKLCLIYKELLDNRFGAKK